MSEYVETEDIRVSREISSKALVASNINELSRTRATRSIQKKVLSKTNNTDSRITAMESRLLNIEDMLSKLLSMTNK